MGSFANRLLIFVLTILVVLLTSSPADVPGQGRLARPEANDEVRTPSTVRRHRRRELRKTPEDAIRRQIERAKERILSQLSYSVNTEPGRGRARMPLPQPLQHDLYSVGMMTGQRDELTLNGARHAVTAHDVQFESNYRQARLIVFDHKSEYAIVRY